ncbi:cysteine proteinase [Hortaea werneckii]|nr:cysteine proteinase [Hortaea werneckii]
MSPLGSSGASENLHLKAYESAHQTPPNPTDGPSNAAKLHGDDLATDEKEVEARGIRPESKRPRTEAETERVGLEQSRKRIRTGPSEQELRLTGNYAVPANAKAIEMPFGYGDGDFLSQPRKPRTMGGVYNKGHRPYNTLAGPAPHAAAKVGLGNGPRPNAGQLSGNVKSKAGADAGKGGQLQFAPSMGSNVPTKSAKLNGRGDDYDINAERSLKRQKTMHEKAPSARMSNTPQSVDDDEIVEVNSPRAGQGLRRGSATSATKPAKPVDRPSEHFNGGYLKQQEMRNTIPPNKRRKPRSSDRQSLNSQSQSSSVIELDQVQTHNGDKGTHQAPYSVADSQEDATNSTSQPQRINLDEGVFENSGPKANARGKTPLQKANNAAANGGLRPQHQQRSRADSVKRQGEHFDSPSFDSHAPSVGRRSTTPPLRKTFQRDPGEPARTQVKARNRMQADSTSIRRNSATIDDSFGSMDELQGATTVQGLARTSASPQRPIGSQESGSRSAAADPQTGQQSVHPPRRTPQRVYEADNSDPKDSNECPISAFYATSCILTGQNSSLVYDADNLQLDLFNDDRPVKVAHKQCVVMLGRNEVHTVQYSKGCNRVVIKGSRTEISYGTICLAFHDYSGVEWLLARLVEISRIKLVMGCIDEERLNKVFEHTTDTIKARVDDLETKRRRQNILERSGLGHKDMGSLADEEEEIVYENGDEQPRPSRRKAMQGGDDDRAAYDRPVQSRHFQALEPARRSARQSKPVTQPFQSRSPERWTHVNRPKEWSHPVTYPAQGARRVTVEFSDLERLDEGEFLNDNIISFAMRRIEEQVAPEEKENVHFFNSYFYSFLTTKNGRKAFNYDAVKRWTKNKDIFSTRYIVVPICVDLHWFVAIICNLPELSRKLAGDDEQEEEVKEGSNALDSGQVTDVEETFEGFGAGVTNGKSKANIERGDSEEQNVRGDETEQKDAQLNAKEESITDSSRPAAANGKKGKRKKTPPTPRKYGPDTPSIITLDSFGSPHTAEIRFLKDYLKSEADAKRGMEFDRDALQGVTAKGIPEQTNFCDCGVYLIGYIEQFAKDPRGFVSKVLSKQLDQQADFASFDPSAKRAEVRDELLGLAAQEAEADRLKKEQKRQRKAAEAAGVKTSEEPATSNGAKTDTKQAPSTTSSAQQSTSPSKDSTHPVRQSGSTSAQAGTSTPAGDVSVNNTSKKASPEPRKVQAQRGKAPHSQFSDNEEDLELALPRALNDPEQSRHGVRERAEAKQNDTETHEDPDAEMLDKAPLLDGLKASLDKMRSKHQEVQSSATVAPDPESSEYEPPPYGGDTKSDAPDTNRSPQELGSRNAEIPDSQEAPALASKR